MCVCVWEAGGGELLGPIVAAVFVRVGVRGVVTLSLSRALSELLLLLVVVAVLAWSG